MIDHKLFMSDRFQHYSYSPTFKCLIVACGALCKVSLHISAMNESVIILVTSNNDDDDDRDFTTMMVWRNVI